MQLHRFLNTFSQLPAVENDTKNQKNCAPEIFFGPSYFVMTLVAMVSSKLGKESNECQEHVSYYEKMHINLKNNKRSTGFA